MTVSSDILRTWAAGPAAVMREHLARGPGEGRALAFLLLACLLLAVARLPALAREAELGGTSFEQGATYTFFALLMVAPLLFYLIALASGLLLRLVGRQVAGWEARLAFFWALLAASPAALLWGLTLAFAGKGAAVTATGLVWFAALLVFWSLNLREAMRR